jgi:hypothetical protein
MTSKPGLLQNIRQQIEARQSGQQEVKPSPKCPKCNHNLTVDYGAYFSSEICENCFDHAKVYENKQCCGNPTLRHVKHVTTSGTIQVKEQCTGCGFVKGTAVGGFAKDQKDRLPFLDEKFREIRYNRGQDEWRSLYDKHREKRVTQLNKQREDRRESWMKEYGKYLSSPEWRQKRELVLKRDNYKCQCCLTGLATQVHHKSYEFVDLSGSEPCFDLVAICWPCHERIENMKAENRKSKP